MTPPTLIVILAIAGSPQCEAPAVLKVPLDSATERHSAIVSRYVVDIARDSPGWVVEVFASGDRKRRDNLLAPQSDWHGAFPFQVQPGANSLFGSVRRLKVRDAQDHVCIRLNEPQVVGERFVGGLLEVGWEAPDTAAARRTTTR
jgi:hypothetical protein